jgi:hypothetical protein
MIFTLPKSLRDLNSLQTDAVLPVELNDLDVDRMLTRILEMAVKRGRTAGSRTNTKEYTRYLDALQANPGLTGFDGQWGRDVLDGWIRSSILKEERAGLRRESVVMGYLRPSTIASYRSGLPKTASRNRRADDLVYRSVWRVIVARGSTNPSKEIDELFTRTFGTGVDVGVAPWADPRYNETDEVDIDTLLVLRFLEGFTASQNNGRERAKADPPVPLAVDPLGTDVVALLELYGPKMSVGEAYAHMSALISLRLLQLPLISARVVRALLSGEEPPSGANPCEMYVDFVRRKGAGSDELTAQCVVRDLEIMRNFFRDRLLIRSIGDGAASMDKPVAFDGSAEDNLKLAANLQGDPEVAMFLRFQLKRIEDELDDESDEQLFVRDVRLSEGLSGTEKFIQVLVEGLRKRGLENQVKWFWSTGGITKSYGLLSGTLKYRPSWRYAPSDEALTTLLCLCFVESDGARTLTSLPIQEVLRRLRDRFGILIDRPPADFDSADARAGAAENLSAFTQRLKLLGCFQGLSDDFSAQFVTRPREAVR